MGQCSLLGFSWERNFRGNPPGDIFQEEVSLNRSNHSTTMHILLRRPNTFNVVSANYWAKCKSFNVAQSMQRIINCVQTIQRSTKHATYDKLFTNYSV